MPSRRWMRDGETPNHGSFMFARWLYSETDSCDKQIACVHLKGRPESTDRKFGYWSCSLDDAECPYYKVHWECVPVVWVVQLLWSHLKRCKFTVRTHKEAFKYALNLTESTGKILYWRPRLSESEFSVVDRTGLTHRAAEALLNVMTTETDQAPIFHVITVLYLTSSNP